MKDYAYMGVSKNRGKKPPNGWFENNGKPYCLMDDLGGKATPIFGSWFHFMTLNSAGGFEMPWDTGARDGVRDGRASFAPFAVKIIK